MTDNTDFLNVLHDVQAKGTEAVEFLQAFIDSDALPPLLRAQFAETRNAIVLQRETIVRLSEMHFQIQDKLDDLVKQLP